MSPYWVRPVQGGLAGGGAVGGWPLVLGLNNTTGGHNAVQTPGDQFTGTDAAAGSKAAGGAFVARGGQGDGVGIDGPVVLLLRDATTGGAVQADQGGNARGRSAVDLQVRRTAATQVASGKWSAILGGYNNTASADASGVFAGNNNKASAAFAIVLGGRNNIASGITSTVLAGNSGAASGVGAAVLGGNGNKASGNYSAAGGYNNTASNTYAAAFGGSGNTASGNGSAALGGSSNNASGTYSAVVGGKGNTASGDYASTLGGENNVAGGKWSAVSGHNNKAAGVNSSVWGGGANYAQGDGSCVVGGQYGHATGQFSTVIGSGYACHASGDGSVVIGGYYTTASGKYSLVVGARLSTASGFTGGVFGGLGALSDRAAQTAHASGRADAVTATTGQTQTSFFDVQAKSLTNAVTELRIGELATLDRMILRPSTSWAFSAIVTGRRIAGAGTIGDTATFHVTGAIRRDAANNTAMVAAATIVPGAVDAGAATWAITCAADDVNEALVFTGQGDAGAATEYYWHATVIVSESGLGA